MIREKKRFFPVLCFAFLLFSESVMHVQAVRAMRFDPAAHKPKDKLPTERTMTDAEVAKAIEEAESEEP